MPHKVSECQNWEVTFFPLTKLAVSFTELLIYVKGFSGQIEQTCPFSDQWLNMWLPLEELE